MAKKTMHRLISGVIDLTNEGCKVRDEIHV
jgi:hypothetical protein